jgi:hypothetical protein
MANSHTHHNWGILISFLNQPILYYTKTDITAINHMTLPKVRVDAEIFLWEQIPVKLCSISMLEENTYQLLPHSVPFTSNYGLKHSCSINKKFDLFTKSTWHISSTGLKVAADTHNKQHMTKWHMKSSHIVLTQL